MLSLRWVRPPREEVADEGEGIGCAGEVGDGGVVGLGCLFLMSCEFCFKMGI